MMNRLCAAAWLALTSAVATAGGNTAAAIPTRIEIVRSEGFMMMGDFGNPAGCAQPGYLFVKADHPQYKLMYATALAAYLGKAKISGYAHACETVSWFSVTPQAFNTVNANSALTVTD